MGTRAALGDGLGAPHPFRRHQQEALEALAEARAAGRRRAWVVLPPGAGKTLVGLETIRREDAQAVVFCPNTAIQGQWVRGWTAFGAEARAGIDRELSPGRVAVLTYQSLAVFDAEGPDEVEDPDDPEVAGGGELARLHANGLALVEALRAAGPLTIVLDECHHLVETWGRLLAEVLALLPDATVLGLTATPPASLSTEQAALVDELFGAIVHETSIPAVVKEGHLAPFVDLVWLTEPTAHEHEWLAAQGERFAELTTALTDPELGSVPFLTWLDRRVLGDVPFAHVAADAPALGDAALRLAHVGLLALPPEVVAGLAGERHRRRPDADDWALLVDGWYDACLRCSDDPRDAAVVEGLRTALPSVGWQLTRTGLRRGRSPVDRVLARSAAKARALVEIVGAEHRALGDRMAMLVVCDHEAASATLPADLSGVVARRAGSARAALAHLLADPVTACLSPLMVTGRTVAGAPDTLRALRERVPDLDLVVNEPDHDQISELVGAWTSRTWVRVVTEHFTARRCQVLVGTRALLGEGWDAPGCTGLVDLSTTTTPGSIVQTRGRTLRLDPEDPGKVAVNWTVCTVSDAHPRGDNDWRRTVRKHQGYFGVDTDGEVVDGIAHVHPDLTPFSPPAASSFGALNTAMVVRSEQRSLVRDAWAVGEPYVDRVRHVAWVHPGRGVDPRPTVVVPSDSAPAVPPLVLQEHGLEGDVPVWRGVPGLAVLGALGAAGAAAAGGGAVLAVLALVLLVGSLALAARRRADLLAEVRRTPDLLQHAWALADGLHAAGLVSGGAELVRWHPSPDGRVRVVLDVSGEGAEKESALFAAALVEVLGPVGTPRYLVPRHVIGTSTRPWLPLSTVRPTGAAWHAVPTAAGVRAGTAQAYAAAWSARLGGGPAVYTGNPTGTGLLAASRGITPLDPEAVLRLGWD